MHATHLFVLATMGLVTVDCRTTDDGASHVRDSVVISESVPDFACDEGLYQPLMLAPMTTQVDESLASQGYGVDLGIGQPGGYPASRQVRLDICFDETTEASTLRQVVVSEDLNQSGMITLKILTPGENTAVVGLDASIFGDTSTLRIAIGTADDAYEVRGWGSGTAGYTTIAPGSIVDGAFRLAAFTSAITGGSLTPGSPWVGVDGCAFGFTRFERTFSYGTAALTFKGCAQPTTRVTRFTLVEVVAKDSHVDSTDAMHQGVTLAGESLVQATDFQETQHNFMDRLTLTFPGTTYHFAVQEYGAAHFTFRATYGDTAVETDEGGTCWHFFMACEVESGGGGMGLPTVK